ncbi:uncharacterized protein [Notamacropus eugenii]|uniref:uncharacterized protein n=1 Tax=Notamacropus eugenii TaxID=9315 RepID=UPI003B6841B1
MLENVQNLLSLVPKESLISPFHQGEAPRTLEPKNSRNSWPDAEIKFEVNETTTKLRTFMEESDQQRFMSDGACDFNLREIRNSNMKVDKNPRSYCEVNEIGKRVRQSSVLNHCKKMTSGNDDLQDSRYSKSFPEQVELFQPQEKPPQMQIYQGNQQEMAMSWSSDVIRYQKNTGETLYVSNKSGKLFKQNFNLLTHKKCHNLKESHEYNECVITLSHHSSLPYYPRFHTGMKIHACNQCGRTFDWNSDLIKHQKIHIGENFYKCNECGMGFCYKSILIGHQRIHTREKPYECNPCGNISATVSHQRVYIRKKTYNYNQYEKPFTQSSRPAVNQRIHAGEKHYECNQCGKTF